MNSNETQCTKTKVTFTPPSNLSTGLVLFGFEISHSDPSFPYFVTSISKRIRLCQGRPTCLYDEHKNDRSVRLMMGVGFTLNRHLKIFTEVSRVFT